VEWARRSGRRAGAGAGGKQNRSEDSSSAGIAAVTAPSFERPMQGDLNADGLVGNVDVLVVSIQRRGQILGLGHPSGID
jgi:hypothetical protein